MNLIVINIKYIKKNQTFIYNKIILDIPKDKTGSLLRAARVGNLEKVIGLLNRKVDVNACDTVSRFWRNFYLEKMKLIIYIFLFSKYIPKYLSTKVILKTRDLF